MKTVGVLGGIGPQATIDFEERFHRAAQQRIPPHGNGGYPPLVVYYHRFPALLVDKEMRPLQPRKLDERLLEAARQLGGLVDFLVIPSNSPHAFRKEIEAAAGCTVLSMVEVTLHEMERRRWKKIGLVGMGSPEVYIQPLRQKGLAYALLASGLQTELDRAIIKLMEGREGEEHRQAAAEAIRSLRRQRVDGIILGCTEIPLLLGDEANAKDLINPAQLLAEAAVEQAI